MTSRFRCLALFLLLSAISVFPQTATITGNITTVGTTSVGANAYLQVELYGCGNNRAMWSGGVISAPYQFTTDTSGSFSGIIVRNDFITCGSTTGGTSYFMQPFINGSPTGPRLQFAVKSGSINWNTATALNVSPIVPAPTGDGTYVRRDGGNTVTGNILPDNDNARSLGSASQRYNVFSNLLTASSFNGSKWLDGITYTTLKACYDAACSGPSPGGGTCFVPPSYTETLTADLVFDKHDCGIKALGSATILQGSNHVVFNPGTTGAFLEGASVAGGPAAASNGFRFIYTGTGAAWQVGSSIVALAVQYPGIKNIWIDITGAGRSALGIQSFGLGHARLDSNFINCTAGVTSQIGFSIDDAAGGAFSGGIASDHLLINNCHTPLRLNGSTVESTFNNNIFLSGSYAGGIGLDLNGTDVASNVFSGGTISGFPTSINFGGNASHNVVTVETDAETTAVVFGSTTHHNEVKRMDSTNHTTPVVTCGGVMNIVKNPGGEYFCGGNLLSDQGAIAAQIGNGTDKVIYTYVVKAGSVAPGKGLRVSYGWNNGSVNSVTYKVFAGAANLASIASTGVDSSQNEGFTFDIINLAGVQNSQTYVRHQKIRDVNVANVTFNNQMEVYGVATVDFTVDQTFTATFNVANPNQINPRLFRVELIQ